MLVLSTLSIAQIPVAINRDQSIFLLFSKRRIQTKTRLTPRIGLLLRLETHKLMRYCTAQFSKNERRPQPAPDRIVDRAERDVASESRRLG